jgi:V8-like Glu-specific endopeptidase
VTEPADETGQCHTRDDWAIMILDARLGDARGYFGAQVIDPSLEGQQNTYTLGYPGDHGATQPYMQNSITVRPMGTTVNADCDAYGPLVTDADVIPGQSGSPLWWKDAAMNRYQLGVLVSGTATDTFAAGGPSWVNAIANARANFNT